MRAKSPAPPPLLEDLVATSVVENDLRAIADEMILLFECLKRENILMDNAKRLVVSCQLWYWYRSWMMLGSEAGRGGERREEEDERIV
eukprot:CAMPEP_0201925218 /NCGR_PEP_ID=MMETSP0903-20130614/14319_1 /ASSEMBLY_ACC=CAM_ASM_000552 /TAXON_ID=420261 /ORGANISM="Thalassiosira antarctica, Strain CCMP982" /LENGTH=87 /DNA_ID=CAMNT_0048462855 /DNA_START=433 /DNA_END=692 /DNA_ORIENTATION=-